MSSRSNLAAALMGLLFASSASAHMMMASPVPYGQSSLNNSPLDNSGSDFPCKQRAGVYDITQMNNMPVGVPQKLSFTGGATHGGGSCQVSVTLDKEPTKNSQWKVIHSIVGGCPSDADGNLSGNPTDSGSNKYQFQIPKGMPNGQYTLAWTWFNKIGNREMYMNCAPITVTGGADGDLSVFNSLPDMFVVNLPREECHNTESQDMTFPDPGAAVETGSKATPGFGVTGSGCAAQTKMGAGAGQAKAPAAPTGAPAASTPSSPATTPAAGAPAVSTPASIPIAVTTTRAAKQPNNPGGVFAPGASAAPTTAPAAQPTTLIPQPKQPSAAPAQPSAPVAAPSAPETPSNSGSAPSGAVKCSTPGAVVCIGSSQFGLCDINGYAVPQALSQGTTCTNGVVARSVSERIANKRRRRALAHGHSHEIQW